MANWCPGFPRWGICGCSNRHYLIDYDLYPECLEKARAHWPTHGVKMPKAIVLRTFADVVSFVQTTVEGGDDVFIVWRSTPPTSNSTSFNAVTGRFEAGLSVNELLLVDDEVLSILTANHPNDKPKIIAMRLTEYAMLAFEKRAKPWLVTGEVGGRGGDNEPLLHHVRLLAEVSLDAAEEARFIAGRREPSRQ